ncbi:MAG: 7,8-didemethyl-8-hydroxy-5-deazariboflavin synthase subunit CofG [Cyanobacteria bacterium REEB417]|nr:7,8-didemethyl-8-hydroxy-5-deazariboflavin synthase subunit CofG [Cyanobacteria bacterium REEB417]
MSSADHPDQRCVTWSPSVTLVPTRQCFNACDYCGFRLPLAAAPRDWLSDGQAQLLLQGRPGASEVLLLSGEVAPGSSVRGSWFARLLVLSRLALQAGRLPHTNAGPLNRHEMAALARFNPSMGLMLEGLGPAHDAAHRHAPSKALAVRLAQLELAGRLGIPFTTGLLVGLGESRQQRREALELLALLQRQWGHLQEVILQPWRPTAAAAVPLGPAERAVMLETIAEARAILPPEVHLQLPPNLWPLEHLCQALEAGIDDLGGIDSGDVINPQHPQPQPARLRQVLAAAGWTLQPRLCVHAAWISWLPARLRHRAERLGRQLLSAG